MGGLYPVFLEIIFDFAKPPVQRFWDDINQPRLNAQVLLFNIAHSQSTK